MFLESLRNTNTNILWITYMYKSIKKVPLLIQRTKQLQELGVNKTQPIVICTNYLPPLSNLFPAMISFNESLV